MDEGKEYIFKQLSMYAKQLNTWEEMVKLDTCLPGDTGNVKDNIQKTKVLIDVLLDRYNNMKNIL